MYEWLDKKREEQKHNIEIMTTICSPYTAAELQEMAEHGELE
ncbi:hypothetical protein LCGC14_2456590 [marine sediment metagenome]|uniref:Uncharacterized protein n=1 Tax=marine sediment metagenome TaxID=412755 RepID=A0A0F9BF30_9ZZZZ